MSSPSPSREQLHIAPAGPAGDASLDALTNTRGEASERAPSLVPVAAPATLPPVLPVHAPSALPLARVAGLFAAAALCLVALGLMQLMLGTPQFSVQDLWAVAQGGGSPLAHVVIAQLRLPRLALGMLAGAMLAVSGALLQDTLRNALAGPELLGVSAGATVVVAAITILHLSVLLALVPWLALAGGLFASGIVVLMMRQGAASRDPARLVLVGAALAALLNAVVITLMGFGSQNDISLLFLFLVGSLANRTWASVQLVVPWAIVCLPLAMLCARPLNVLRLGDDVARGLGVRVARLRVLILVLGTALVAAVVAVCGPIAFVALLAPHLTRRLLATADARVVLPCAAAVGAVLLTGADALARLAFAPQELPVGVFTTLVGGPLLLVLLRRESVRRRAAGDRA